MSNRAAPGYESLAYLVKPGAAGRLGVENEAQISHEVWEYNSGERGERSRFVLRIDGITVAAVLVKDNEVVAIYTKRGHRRRGYASRLLYVVRTLFPALRASDDQSAAGRELFKSTGLA